MKKLALAVIMISCISGCATSQGGLAQRAGLYYPQCYLPLQQARQLDSKARDVAEGAGKGFLLGTLAGLAGGAVSALFTGDPINIVSGAAIGAAGGTVAGGVSGGMQNNQAQKNALLAQWYPEIEGSIEGLSFNGAAATVSIQCYNKRLQELRAEEKDGIITPAIAEPRLQEIELGRQEAFALLQSGS